MIHCRVQARCSLPPKWRTSDKALCSFHQGALPSTRKACENAGIQWKNACQLSMPKASQEANASAAPTIAAVTNTVHSEVAISTSGNKKPYCGLKVRSPRQMPESTGRVG